MILEIKGAIGGPGSLTKQGYDMVTLSGANTYAGGTNVVQGTLRIGANDSLPTAGDVSTTGASVLDINGFNQTIGRLTSPSTGATAATTNATGSGYITNTATEFRTLTVGNAATLNSIYGGVIQYNVSVIKAGTNVQTLSNNNTYAGATTVSGGTLTVTGSLSGTTAVQTNAGGTLLLNSSTAANNIINQAATYTGNGGTLKLDDSQSGRTNTFASLTVSANSTVDFGALDTNTFVFCAIDAATRIALAAGTKILTIDGWSGTGYVPSETADHGPVAQDRFLFTADPGFTPNTVIPGINFTGFGQGMQVSFGGQFEIVPVPEPATAMLLGSVALCALIGHRGRRRTFGRN